ncbi:hypothetical protein BGZ94_000089 [Podila epigama]|nr:hypothetical protein BGZ94_000089 [Podila epigama]
MKKFRRQKDSLQPKVESGTETTINPAVANGGLTMGIPKLKRANSQRLATLDIPLMMTFTPSSPCDPSSSTPMSFPPAEELIHSDQLHPYATPTSAGTYTFGYNNSSSSSPSKNNNNSNDTNKNNHNISPISTRSSTANSRQDLFPTKPSSNAPSLPAATMIEIERIMKQDHAIQNDFTPPRQAMNSDQSDFDWDEDINIDENGQVRRKRKDKVRSKWRRLSPFLRMVLMMLLVAPFVALPAILTEIFWKDPEAEKDMIKKDTVVLIFTWLAFMWCIVCVTNWGVDIIPVVVVRLTSIFSGVKLETIKSRMLIFVATKKYIKWLLASCWATGSFAFLSHIIHPLIEAQLWRNIMIKVLAAIIAGTALVLVEKVLLQIISKNFHQTAYADRIKENKYALMVLDKLGTSKKNVAKKMRPTHSRNTTAENCDYMNPFPGASGGYRSRQQSRSQSIDNGDNHLTDIANSANNTPLPTPTELGGGGSGNNTRHSSMAPRSIRGQRDSKAKNDILKGVSRTLQSLAMADSTPTKDINSTENAKRLAKTLFYNLQGHDDELVVEDFYPYFDTQDEAREAFAIFDKDGNGDISKREMKEKIFYIYKERKDLHTSLRDLSQAVGKLDIIFLTIVTVVWLLIILSIFGTSVVQNMLSIGSFLVALSFVFGNSLKTLFENIVFLFITHPYDSGDLCNIDGTDMYVREVGLNSTMFVTWDGKRMYYPNNVLSQKPIHNVRRSPNMSEKIVLNVDCYTPQAKIFELRARMRDFLARESKEFLPDMEIQIQEMDVKLKISMVIEHKGNWQDTGRRWARRTKFNFALKEAVEEIGIKYYALPQRLEVVERDVVPTHETLGPNSPHRQYSPDQVSHLFRRNTSGRRNAI